MRRIKSLLILMLTVCFIFISCSDEIEIPFDRLSSSSSSSTSGSSSSQFTSSSQGPLTIGLVTIEDLGSGSAKFSLRLSEQKVQVHLFCKKNNIQDYVIIDLQITGEVNNGDGTYTYTQTRIGAYVNGDSIVARYYTYTPASGQVFYQGPTDSTWSVPLVYGGGAASSSSSAASSSSQAPLPQVPAPSNSSDTWSSGAGWTLVWADEFNGTVLNMANWTHQVLPAGHFNAEWQRYTDSTNNSFIFHANDEGYLVIRALHDGGPIASDHYTSARLHTGWKQDFQYGKIAARIQLPFGQGLWPAFWMLGTNISEIGGDTDWPACGEIDIMEMTGGEGTDPAHPNWDNSVYSGAIHWDNGGWAGDWNHEQLSSGILADDFHVFEIEWDSMQVVWKMDGLQFFSKDITPDYMSEFRKRFYILLNVAVGGNNPGPPVVGTIFPQYMYVDWVRVYSKD